MSDKLQPYFILPASILLGNVYPNACSSLTACFPSSSLSRTLGSDSNDDGLHEGLIGRLLGARVGEGLTAARGLVSGRMVHACSLARLRFSLGPCTFSAPSSPGTLGSDTSDGVGEGLTAARGLAYGCAVHACRSGSRSEFRSCSSRDRFERYCVRTSPSFVRFPPIIDTPYVMFVSSHSPSVCVARRCAIAGEGQLASSREEMTESVVRVTSSWCSNDGNELNSGNCSLNSSLGATTSRRVYYNDKEHQKVSAVSGQSKNGFGSLRRDARGSPQGETEPRERKEMRGGGKAQMLTLTSAMPSNFQLSSSPSLPATMIPFRIRVPPFSFG